MKIKRKLKIFIFFSLFLLGNLVGQMLIGKIYHQPVTINTQLALIKTHPENYIGSRVNVDGVLVKEVGNGFWVMQSGQDTAVVNIDPVQSQSVFTTYNTGTEVSVYGEVMLINITNTGNGKIQEIRNLPVIKADILQLIGRPE